MVVSSLARGARAHRARRRHHSKNLRENQMRILHTMLRVGNLERSIKFYTEVLGMKLLRTTDRPDQKYSLAFVGYDSEDKAAVIELTYNYGVDKYDLGSGFGHLALEMPNVAKACADVKAKGGKVTREAGPVKG